MGVWYTTREEVASSPDIKAAAYAAPQLDRAIEAGARRVERLCHRIFYPWTGTKRFDYPLVADALNSGTLYLDDAEIVSLTSLVTGGVSIPTSSVFLEPTNDGPPYDTVALNLTSSYVYGGAQQGIAITGVWSGAPVDEISVGTLTAGINASVTTLPLTAPVGVGSVVRVDSERMLVTEKLWVTSGQTGSLAASNAAQSLTVSDATVFFVGDELIMDSERLIVLAIVGATTLLVQRAWSGSTLAAHTAATIYWPHQVTVTRGALGTTAATHSIGAAAVRHLAPGPVQELNQAYALDSYFQAGAGYARTIGSGETERQMSGRAIRDLETRVYDGYARKARFRAV